MSESISGQTRTPPHFKWLLNERAMLLGEVQRREVRITGLTAEAEQLRTQVAALDSAMALFDSRVDPQSGGSVKAIGDRYGGRGGLNRFLLAQVADAGDEGVDTVTLTIRAASRFGIVVDSIKDRNTYRDTIGRALRDFRRKGTIENATTSRGGHTASTWRLTRQTSIHGLAVRALALNSSSHG